MYAKFRTRRLANLGIGHGAIDDGGAISIRRPGTNSQACSGFTYNFQNQSTQYQNGVDMHFDWGASQFLTKQFQVGLVGYVYKEIGCDSGSGDRVGCSNRRWSASGRSSASSFRSVTCKATSI